MGENHVSPRPHGELSFRKCRVQVQNHTHLYLPTTTLPLKSCSWLFPGCLHMTFKMEKLHRHAQQSSLLTRKCVIKARLKHGWENTQFSFTALCRVSWYFLLPLPAYPQLAASTALFAMNLISGSVFMLFWSNKCSLTYVALRAESSVGLSQSMAPVIFILW